MSRLHALRDRLADEQGSIVFAVLAAIIVAGLVAVMTATTVQAQRTIRHDRDFTGVLHVADAGVQEALFRLNSTRGVNDLVPESGGQPCQWTPDESSPAASCVRGQAGDGEYEWYAERTGATRQWEVYSTGELEGVRRSLRVVVEEDRRFFASAFAIVNANFGNNNVADSYNSGRVGSPRWPGPGRLGIVGSNGTIDTGGTSSRLDGVQLWNLPAGTDPLSRCTGQARLNLDTGQRACSEWAMANPIADTPFLERFEEPRAIVPEPADLADSLAECGGGPYPDLTLSSSGVRLTMPSGATHTIRPVPVMRPFTENGDVMHDTRFVGAPRVGTPGTDGFTPGHYCFRNITVEAHSYIVGSTVTIPSSTASLTPEMADPDDPVIIYATGAVDVANSQRVNCIGCPLTEATATSSSPAPPRAAALQVYLHPRVSTDPAPRFRQGGDAMWGGTVFGPTAECGNPGSAKAEIYGSMMCNVINNVGQWKFHYDESLEFIGNSIFTSQRWDER